MTIPEVPPASFPCSVDPFQEGLYHFNLILLPAEKVFSPSFFKFQTKVTKWPLFYANQNRISIENGIWDKKLTSSWSLAQDSIFQFLGHQKIIQHYSELLHKKKHLTKEITLSLFFQSQLITMKMLMILLLILTIRWERPPMMMMMMMIYIMMKCLSVCLSRTIIAEGGDPL